MRASPSLLAAVSLLRPAVGAVYPEPPTPFQVTMESMELTDLNRTDPFNETHLRRIMISKFSPVPRSACLETCRVNIMSETAASVQDELIATYVNSLAEGAKWPRGLFASTEMELCCKVKEDCGGEGHGQGKVPTILFGPGLNGTRFYYSGLAQHIAGMGYEVITLDHPYDCDIVEFPDGTSILSRWPDDLTDEVLAFALDVRAADASFVLDTLGFAATDRVIHIGHSFGGAASATAMAKDGRIAGGADLDGAVYGPVMTSGVDRPFLLFGTTGHNSSLSLINWADFINATHSRGAWLKELSLKDTLHFTVTDVSVFADVNDLRGDEVLVEVLFGAMLGSRAMEILREYLSDFFDFVLGGEDEGLLGGTSEQFPDVTFYA